ncbi:MAG: neutral/alkaline non-lysosomal ceramidase N-terminal domain-containing protein [Anaerolineae bacterium]|jgi:neutral ceramidase
MKRLMAGHGRVRITPRYPVHMAGYGYRSAKSAGVHDDLFANAVYLTDGSSRALIVALDLCSFDDESLLELKGAIEARTGLEPAEVLVNTSHTHAGPMTTRRAYQPFEPGYLGGAIVWTAEAAAAAIQDAQPAALAVGRAPVEIGGNRRQFSPDGTVTLGVNPEGETLQEVSVWRLIREQAPDLILWTAPVHGVVMGDNNLMISSEWMGATVRVLEAADPGLRAVFLQGCCGDQNPLRQGSTFGWMDALAERAARGVQQALLEAREVDPLPLVNRFTTVDLLIAEEARTEQRHTEPCPVHGLRLGEAALVGLAGEPFVRYALYGRALHGEDTTMVLGYTDGTIGYLPTKDAYDEGGYEPGAYVWYPDGVPLDPNVESVVKDGMLRLLKEMGAVPA